MVTEGVMQDSGADVGVDPKKIEEWRDMLLKHTKRATLGTVAVPGPGAEVPTKRPLDPDSGWVETPMLTVVLQHERAQLRIAAGALVIATGLALELREEKRQLVEELERYKQQGGGLLQRPSSWAPRPGERVVVEGTFCKRLPMGVCRVALTAETVPVERAGVETAEVNVYPHPEPWPDGDPDG